MKSPSPALLQLPLGPGDRFLEQSPSLESAVLSLDKEFRREIDTHKCQQMWMHHCAVSRSTEPSTCLRGKCSSSPVTSTPAQFLFLTPLHHIPGDKSPEKQASHWKSHCFQQGQDDMFFPTPFLRNAELPHLTLLRVFNMQPGKFLFQTS